MTYPVLLTLPPFCALGTDHLPDGPPPGTPQSAALAAWEVLTGARVARSTGSGRMSLLARYERDSAALDNDRIIWIALHAFEGAGERWACRRALRPAASDDELRAFVVQEMGGPASDPEEMTTLGFWRGDVGFYFDSRGPAIEVTELRRGGAKPTHRTRRIRPAALVRFARSMFAFAAPAGARPEASLAPGFGAGAAADSVQLMLL